MNSQTRSGIGFPFFTTSRDTGMRAAANRRPAPLYSLFRLGVDPKVVSPAGLAGYGNKRCVT
jgi:hypothetical protein